MRKEDEVSCGAEVRYLEQVKRMRRFLRLVRMLNMFLSLFEEEESGK